MSIIIESHSKVIQSPTRELSFLVLLDLEFPLRPLLENRDWRVRPGAAAYAAANRPVSPGAGNGAERGQGENVPVAGRPAARSEHLRTFEHHF